MNTEFSQVLANEMVSFIGVFLSHFAYIKLNGRKCVDNKKISFREIWNLDVNVLSHCH